MRRIALAILASAFTFALAAPALADGWTGWKTFASHNGVVLEWRTYSHPEHDTKADWRVTNNTTKVLYELWLGQRTYSCENGYTESFVSSAFGGIEGKELNPGLSAIFSTDNETLDYLGADNIDRASCPSIAEAAFDEGISKALEFAVEPLEPVKPWMEHNFAASESRELSQSVATCNVPSAGICFEYVYERESASIEVRNHCESALGGNYLPDGSCPKEGTAVCSDIQVEQWGAVVSWYVFDIDRFIDQYSGLTKDQIRDMTLHEKEIWSTRSFCHREQGTYMGFQ